MRIHSLSIKGFISLLFLLCLSCEKDDIKRKHASAIISFDPEWKSNEAIFSYEKNNTLAIRFNKDNDSGDRIHQISFKNIHSEEGIINLRYLREGSGLVDSIPTSYFQMFVGDDALGENYVLFESENFENILELNCVTKNRISGRFQVAYVISEFSLLPKIYPEVPDTFYVEDGIFDAVNIE